MPNLPLLSSAYAKPRETYNQPRLTSYAGYPVLPASKFGLDKYFANEGKKVGGMAWGGPLSPPEMGGPKTKGGKYDTQSIVVNPYQFKNNTMGYNALVQLEASRHLMNELDYNPNFKITPELQKWREEAFSKKNVGDAGEAYLKNDKAFKQTIISRLIVGDEIGPIPKEAMREAELIYQKMEDRHQASKPTITQSIMSAMGMKNK